MKLFFFIFNFLIISNYAFSNEIEVIELHETKSLDQMVLEELNNDDVSQPEDEIILNEDINDEAIENIENNSVEAKPLEKDDFWNKMEDDEITSYLNNSKNLKSKVLIN